MILIDKDARWIIEAVVERIDIKHQLYLKLIKLEPDSMVSSNTSTVPYRC